MSKHITQGDGVCFGQPHIRGHGVYTYNVYDLFLAGESIPTVARYFCITEAQVRAAIRYERKRLRKPEKRKKRVSSRR